MNRKDLLYVENIPPSSSEEHLITYLEKWAPVQQVYFLREKQCTKRSIAAFVRVANVADLDLLMKHQQIYRGKRLFMVRGDQPQFFQADHTVIVRNISSKISEENLYDHFEECGQIGFLQIRSDDFAYIGFEDKSSVRNAMNKNNMPLNGSNLKIQLLTRNIEIMIVNLDTLHSTMPSLYRKMILPIEPRQHGVGQHQSRPPQQQQFQPARQQQTGNQQQDSQPAKQQPQQHMQPQQQSLPQRQQQQPQQMPTNQLLEEKANTFAGEQQPQQKPPQQVSVVPPVKPGSPVPTRPKPPIIEPLETTAILDDESDSSVVPPTPLMYKPQPNDIMRPVKASEISMSVVPLKTPNDSWSVWVYNIKPETRRLTLVLYMEQFGDVESCKISSSSQCYFTRLAKVSFTCEEAVKRATEYFLHPFQGQYLFVLACNRSIDDVPGKVFVLDYLSQYLVYEDVVKSFKHVGDVFYLMRMLDNAGKVRIFFLTKVDEQAVLAVKSIGGRPINVEPYTVGMELKTPNNLLTQYKLEREVIDPRIEARMAKIIEVYEEEELNHCDPIVNPDGISEGNEVIISNVHTSTTTQQIQSFFKSIGDAILVRRQKEPFNENFERVHVKFRTLSMVLKATDLPADMSLNGYQPFIFAAWTKPRMSERNTVRFFFESKHFTVQDVYNATIHFGKIRHVEKEKPKKALVVFDGHDNGINNCKISPGFHVGNVLCIGKAKYCPTVSLKQKMKGAYNIESRMLMKETKTKRATTLQKTRMKQAMAANRKQAAKQEKLIANLKKLLRAERVKRGELEPIVVPQKKSKKPNQNSPQNMQQNQGQQKQKETPPEQQQQERKIPPQQQRQQERTIPPQQQHQKWNIPPHQQHQERKIPPQQKQKRPPKQVQQQEWKRSQQQQHQHHQRSSRARSRSPFVDNSSPQRRLPYHQQEENQRCSMNRWEEPDNQGSIWNDQQERQEFQRQRDQFMPDDRFNRINDDPFDRFDQRGRNMNQFDQMDMDDPPLDRRWGHQQQQQQHFNRSNSPFRRGFREDGDDDDLNYGIPSNIPDDTINEYILRKEEAIKRRLEELELQLITSAVSSRNQDFGQADCRRGNGDVHYGSNRNDVARNRDQRGIGFGGGGGRSRGRQGGRREREENWMHRN